MADIVAQDHLRSFVERVERLHEERKSIADDIRDIFVEARSHGFDVPALKAVIKLRAMDQNEREERETLVDLYLNALGMSSRVQAHEEAA